MEHVEKRLKNLSYALQRFNESLTKFKSKTIAIDPELHNQIRDSVIKRFEFSVDLFWKCLKDHLKFTHGIDVASPKSTLKECLRQKLISEQELELLTAMIDDRNNTSHCYEESIIQEIAQRAYQYYKIMFEVKHRLK